MPPTSNAIFLRASRLELAGEPYTEIPKVRGRGKQEGAHAPLAYEKAEPLMTGLSNKLKKMASDAAYAAGYGYGKVRNAIQDVADRPDVQRALNSAQHAASDAAHKAADLTDHLSPALREAVDKAVPAIGRAASTVSDAAQHTVVPAVQSAAHKAVPAVRDAAAKVAPAVRDAAAKAAPVVKQAAAEAGAAAVTAAQHAGGSAAAVARKAGTAAATAACSVATKNAAGMRDADARPHTVIDPTTGQKVTVEAYVRRPDGSRDYNAVYPRGTKSDFGPVGNKLVGMLLIMAGVPMLVLPGPGTAAIAAGLYFLRKGDAEERAKPQSPDDQAFHKGEDASDPRANETLTDRPKPTNPVAP